MSLRGNDALRPVHLLTDFGTEDPYVGLMKSVLLNQPPYPPVVDLTHQISPQDESEAAFLLQYVVPDLPSNSIILLVVDPKVGTERDLLAVKLKAGPTVVAPDRGLTEHLEWETARLVDASNLYRDQGVSTFHGRDRFAPVGRYLATGGSLRTLGSTVERDSERRLLPDPTVRNQFVDGQIVYVDRFGNLITNIPADYVDESGTVEVNGNTLPIVETYGGGEEAVGLVGSFKRLEIAWVDGSANEELAVGRGSQVVLKTN